MSSPRRDRRGRGARGPAIAPPRAPGDLAVRGRPNAKQRFDAVVLGIVTEIDRRWSSRLGLVEYAVEDTPIVPDDWDDDAVPLSSLVRGIGGQPTRLVLFRRPIENRCEGREELQALVLTLVVEQVADLL
ncbi:metallopeptidase family protein, partial [Nocardioides dubius]